MRSIHIACGQFVASPGDKKANLTTMKRLSREAAEKGCELVVFPEMAVTGYLPPEQMPELAETADGYVCQTVSEMAAAHGIAVAFGYPERIEGQQKKRNTFSLIDKSGTEILRYRKMHLWDTETVWCDPGSEIPLVDFDGVNISGWICYDTRFPEMARLEFLAGAELCLVPTAWLGPVAEWELSVQARALDNTMFVAGADLINPLPGLECKGASLIADPHGSVLAKAEIGKECIIDAVLDPVSFNTQRNRLPLMRDRMPNHYKPLAGS